MSVTPNEERSKAMMKVQAYFSDLEIRLNKEKPGIAEKLIPAILEMVTISGKNRKKMELTPRSIFEAEKFLNVGFAILGEWLRLNECDGFDIPLQAHEQAAKLMAPMFVTMPSNIDELIDKTGLLEERKLVQREMTSFSHIIAGARQFGFTPMQIAGTLMVGSTSPMDNDYRSNALRNALDIASKGNVDQLYPFFQNWATNKSIKSLFT